MKEKIKPYVKYIVCASVPVLLFTAFFIIRQSDIAVSVYIKRFSYPLRQTIGSVVQYIPFSLMEVFYGAMALWCVYFLVRSVIAVRKADKKWDALLRRALTLIIVILYICSLYSMVFGLDYYGQSFQEKAGIGNFEISIGELEQVTRYFAEMANEYSVLVPRGDGDEYIEDLDYVFSYAQSCYDGIYDEFPFLRGDIFRPKRVLFSAVMSYAGFTGVYFPFFGESNINVHSPDPFIPATIAHEIAHQKGVTSEAECNFIGILACTKSENYAYIYSGYLVGLVHLMNALGGADRDAWIEIRSGFSPQLQHDWDENNRYWQKMELPVTSLIDALYDGYLKGYGQTLGTASYGACVNLLVWYFRDTAGTFEYGEV